ncbi:MAG: hypothetical protein N3D82_03295 [Ignisphaera sp.]|nr:hypothetical protein [Ignisphaera sp.]MCX8168035.1 hypothetical protein [Ignisphaera sp.]MDW8086265.1 hypothetical protein [Ignisphaera sp.]
MSERGRAGGKRLVPISEDLFDRLLRVSMKVGINPRDLFESIVSRVLDILEYDPELSTAIESLDAYRDLLRISGILLPRNAVYKLLNALDDSHIDDVVAELRNSCRWFARMSAIKRGGDPRELKLLLSLWFPDAVVDVMAVDSSKLKIVVSQSNGGRKVMRIIREVSVELLKSLGAEVENVDEREGVVAITVSYRWPS